MAGMGRVRHIDESRQGGKDDVWDQNLSQAQEKHSNADLTSSRLRRFLVGPKAHAGSTRLPNGGKARQRPDLSLPRHGRVEGLRRSVLPPIGLIVETDTLTKA